MPWNRGFTDQVKLGDWQFSYSVSSKEDDGTRIVSYEYSHSTASDVKAAATALNAAAEQLARRGIPFSTRLVFERPLAIDEFFAFVRDTGIMPVGSELRTSKGLVGVTPEQATDVRGRSIIGQPKPGGKPLDTDWLAQFHDSNGHGSIIGVISTDTTLDTATYEKVRQAPHVFAIDVMQQILSEEIQHHHPFAWSDKIHTQNSTLYMAMERTGIAPEPK
jgi:hypothetical protein